MRQFSDQDQFVGMWVEAMTMRRGKSVLKVVEAATDAEAAFAHAGVGKAAPEFAAQEAGHAAGVTLGAEPG